MAAHGIQFPEFMSIDEYGTWRLHVNKRSVSATKASRHCGKLIKLFKIVDNKIEETELA
jgi:hypothetical protein